MPKLKFWTSERLLQAALVIAQQDQLPTVFTKPDVQNPASYLSVAAAAVGEDATASGLFQQLTHKNECAEPGLGGSVLGGIGPLLEQLAVMSERSTETQPSDPVLTEPPRNRLLTGVLRALVEHGFLTRPHPGRTALFRALALVASSTMPATPPATGTSNPEPGAASPTSGTNNLDYEADTALGAVRSPSRSLQECEEKVKQLASEIDVLSKKLTQEAKAADVLGRSNSTLMKMLWWVMGLMCVVAQWRPVPTVVVRGARLALHVCFRTTAECH